MKDNCRRPARLADAPAPFLPARATRRLVDALNFAVRQNGSSQCIESHLCLPACLASLVLSRLCDCNQPDNGHRVPPVAGTRCGSALLETTDIHSNVMSYDYYKLAEDAISVSSARPTLILTARKEFDEQPDCSTRATPSRARRSPTSRRWSNAVACDQELAIYKAMDALGYDAGTIGNHEFNYGLPFLSQVTGTPFDVTGVPVEKCKGPNFPFVLSNVFSAKDGKPLYAPWRVLTRTIQCAGAGWQRARGDAAHRPARLHADRRSWNGTSATSTARSPSWAWSRPRSKYVPRAEKGRRRSSSSRSSTAASTPSPYTPNMENAGWHLAGVPGIDAMLLGHSHQIFPDPGRSQIALRAHAEVDNERGFVRGVPAVMGNYLRQGHRRDRSGAGLPRRPLAGRSRGDA